MKDQTKNGIRLGLEILAFITQGFAVYYSYKLYKLSKEEI
ncbi:Uncharacterised protein [Staphylococcus aureus]|nr:Uncharacterised protein [Staphylococcus aureus]